MEFNGTHYIHEITYLNSADDIYYKEIVNTLWGITVFLEIENVPQDIFMGNLGFSHFRWVCTTPLPPPDPSTTSTSSTSSETSSNASGTTAQKTSYWGISTVMLLGIFIIRRKQTKRK